MPDLFAEKLNWFKKNERPETVLIIADAPRLARIAVAWTNIAVRRMEPLSALKGATEAETWSWLWDNTDFSMQDLFARSSSSGLAIGALHEFVPLTGNRILYPDGTLNSYVRRYLRRNAMQLLESARRRRPKP
jgi:hypothetical protein